MDIAAMSIGLSQAKVVQQVNLSVMKMAMDSAENKMLEMVNMIDTSNHTKPVNPNLGKYVDIKA